MDLSVKTLWTILLTFMGIFLLLSIVSFLCVTLKARDCAYAIVEYIEIYGYGPSAKATIDSYAKNNGVTVIVSQAGGSVHGAGDLIRYKVQVSFRHVFSILSIGRTSTFTVYTRAITY